MKIASEQKSKIRDICKNHGIKILVLFGSALFKTPRDIDLAVFPEAGVSPDIINKLQLISEFESLFSKKADIVVINPGTSTTLLYEICRKSLLLYEGEPGSFEDERSLAFRKYADTFKFRRLREKTIKNFARS